MGRTKVIFLCPHLTKSRFPAGPLLQLPSKSSWPPALIYWALEGGSCLQKTVLNVCRHGGLNPSVQKLPDLRTRTRTKDGPRSCSAPTSGWALGHRWTLPTLQTLRTTITKRLNEVDSTKQDSSSYNYMLKINLINLYWILNLFRGTVRIAGTRSNVERWRGDLTLTVRLCCCRLTIFKSDFFFHLESSQMWSPEHWVWEETWKLDIRFCPGMKLSSSSVWVQKWSLWSSCLFLNSQDTGGYKQSFQLCTTLIETAEQSTGETVGTLTSWIIGMASSEQTSP